MLDRIEEHLCAYDKRNPYNVLDCLDVDYEIPEKQKEKCYCDDCYYGRTEMAEEIIRLKLLIIRLKLLIKEVV